LQHLASSLLLAILGSRCTILLILLDRHTFLAAVGARVRSRREERGLSRRQLSERSQVSERFLAQLEAGDGNISLARFAQVATALGLSPAELLAGADLAAPPLLPVALLGVRGAGKSTVGAALAARMSVPFVELDQTIETASGLAMGELFELHGEAHYRELEREALRRVLDGTPLILATGGSIVSDRDSYAYLRQRARTVWLRARPEDHWDRVIRQGDRRPMAENPHAFAQLSALLAAREPLYAAAHHVIETSGRSLDQVVEAVREVVATRS
jgi:XRE family transcriptional regulator, aerobic/anaerobic benzoate catabolism transcriptional regulator